MDNKNPTHPPPAIDAELWPPSITNNCLGFTNESPRTAMPCSLLWRQLLHPFLVIPTCAATLFLWWMRNRREWLWWLASNGNIYDDDYQCYWVQTLVSVMSLDGPLLPWRSGWSALTQQIETRSPVTNSAAHIIQWLNSGQSAERISPKAVCGFGNGHTCRWPCWA